MHDEQRPEQQDDGDPDVHPSITGGIVARGAASDQLSRARRRAALRLSSSPRLPPRPMGGVVVLLRGLAEPAGGGQAAGEVGPVLGRRAGQQRAQAEHPQHRRAVALGDEDAAQVGQHAGDDELRG